MPSRGAVEGRVKSGARDAPTEIRVQNRSARDITVMWLDQQGNRRPDHMHSVNAGGEGALETHVGHAWIAIDPAGHTLGIYIVPDGETGS